MKTPPSQWANSLENWLWQHDLASQSGIMRFVWHFCRVLFAVVRDVIGGQVTLHAMGLVYTTLLSLVPLLALSFSVLKGLGAHNEMEPLLRNFVEPLGEKGDEIVTGLLGFVDNIKVGVLGSVGLGILVYTVISLVQKVERSFNEIWRVSQIRPLAQRFSNYLSVIIIGPVLIVSALGATATLVRSDVVQELVVIQPFGWLFSNLTQLMPYVFIAGLFTFVYMFIPNTRVRFGPALVGGITAGIAWQSAVFGFTRFAANSGNYDAIYSGFAVGILALIWLYVSWLILLMGASVTYYSQNAMQITRERFVEPSAYNDEMAGLAIMHKVLQSFDQGKGRVLLTDFDSELAFDPAVTHRMTDRLLEGGMLAWAGEEADGVIMACSPDKVSMADLLRLIRRPDQGKCLPQVDSDAVLQVLQEQEALTVERFSGLTLQEWSRTGISDGAVNSVT